MAAWNVFVLHGFERKAWTPCIALMLRCFRAAASHPKGLKHAVNHVLFNAFYQISADTHEFTRFDLRQSWGAEHGALVS